MVRRDQRDRSNRPRPRLRRRACVAHATAGDAEHMARFRPLLALFRGFTVYPDSDGQTSRKVIEATRFSAAGRLQRTDALSPVRPKPGRPGPGAAAGGPGCAQPISRHTPCNAGRRARAGCLDTGWSLWSSSHPRSVISHLRHGLVHCASATECL